MVFVLLSKHKYHVFYPATQFTSKIHQKWKTYHRLSHSSSRQQSGAKFLTASSLSKGWLFYAPQESINTFFALLLFEIHSKSPSACVFFKISSPSLITFSKGTVNVKGPYICSIYSLLLAPPACDAKGCFFAKSLQSLLKAEADAVHCQHRNTCSDLSHPIPLFIGNFNSCRSLNITFSWIGQEWLRSLN